MINKKKSQKKKKLIIATHNDMDGVCVGALFIRKKILTNDFPEVIIDYLTVDQVSTFSLDEQRYDFTCDLPKIGESINIDHHQSNYEILLSQGRLEKHDIVDPEAPSATVLVSKYLELTDDDIAKEITDFANLADTGRLPTKYRKMDLCLSMYSDDPTFLKKLSTRLATNGLVVNDSKWLTDLYNGIKNDIEKTHIIIKDFLRKNNCLPNLLLLDTRGVIPSKLAKEAFKPIIEAGVDVMGVIYSPNPSAPMKVSFRTSRKAQREKKYKVNTIAEQFGGGGHPAAAAFSAKKEDVITELIVAFENMAQNKDNFGYFKL